MAKANVDPAELRQFARDLAHFNNELSQLMGSLTPRVQNLKRSWQDQEQVKFMEEFEQAMKVLRRFIGVTEGHVAYLVKKAQYIDDYLRSH
jgi:uncharacterized protein YukE